jgi:cobalamin biosynthesis Co2+ chelatase CbiK
VEQALERAVANGVKNLIVQPTHLMHGSEYDELADAVQAYSGQFDSVKIAEPLLGAVGEDATVINEDKAAVAEILTAEAVADSGYGSLEEAAADSVAYVFMGHGTSHTAKVSYSQMQTQMDELGYDNVFVGTVEGEPEETACEAVIQSVADKGYKKIVLRPLMVVAGDHANNDMAGADEDSWASRFTATGDFDRVDTQIEGLGRIPGIQQLYVEHTGAAMAGDEIKTQADETNSSIGDGRYLATFRTDSSMFHVNEACDGKGTLTVENGRMTIHISLVSKNIVNLYVGLASDAQKEGAVLLEPTEDTVTYSDGTSEEVYGFDVPVPALDQEFDLALLGTKGTWYDHKVSVSDPVAIEDDTQTGAAAQWEDGTYSVELTFSGGSGKAKILSPATVTIKDGAATARIQWSSENYDYMLVDGEKYLPLSTEGGSVFEIPVQGFDVPLDVIGDTVAMSTPHEIAYTIVLAANTMTPVE